MPFLYQGTRDGKGMEITGFSGEIRDLRIPAVIEDMPVTAIAPHAFSGRSDIRRVILPDSIYSLGAFSFYSCPDLEEIILCDEIEDYYDGVIRNCKSLSEICVRMHRDNYDLIRRLLADNDRRLRFFLKWQASETASEKAARLTFPEYVYKYQEDTRARAFHFRIEGGGYKYRECISRRGIDFRAYDANFYWAMVDDILTASEIAFDRLLYPMELSVRAREDYEDFLKKQAADVLAFLIKTDRTEEISYMTGRRLIPEAALPGAVQAASAEKRPEICGMLMEYKRQRFSEKPSGTGFSLEDW